MDAKPIKDVVELAYPWAEALIPGLAVFMPRDAVLGIIDSIEIGHNQRLDVDIKPFDVLGIMNVAREISQAALQRNPHERREAIYALLKFITTIEDHMSLEDWMVYAEQAKLPEV